VLLLTYRVGVNKDHCTKKKAMNLRLEKLYKENRQIMDSLVGLEIKSATEEQYFFEGKLDKESRGTLKLEFSNGQEIYINCDIDAESLKIQKEGFSNKGTLETDFEDERYKWREKQYLSKEELQPLGQIEKAEIEILTREHQRIQSGCRISFQNGNFLHIWTTPSDNIFYEINQEPNCYQNQKVNVELKK
jgi:hypothetical protein